MNNFTYFECTCKDFKHVIRFYYDEELDCVSMEFKIENMPGTVSQKYSGNKINRFFQSINYRLKKIKNYFINILYAIKGRPLWYNAYIDLDKKEMIRLKNYLNDVIFYINKNKNIIKDGFGNAWSSRCPDCGGKMEIVRPGKVQCTNCC